MATGKRKGGGRSSGGGGFLMLVVICALLAVTVWVAYSVWRQPPAEPVAGTQGAAESADLISDDRMIYGGMPRAAAGAGEEAAFEVLKNSAYVVGYSEGRKDPLWVAYRVFHNVHPFELPRPKGGFMSDVRTSAHVKESDFSHSGYDRGHMAPNSSIARCYGAQAQVETFLLSNICPQSPALNEKVWEKLEVDERQYADSLEEVWVIDGPVFGDLNHGETERLASGISVPRGFYKILLDEKEGRPRVFSVIMPQEVKGTELPQEFLSSVSEIEKETHLEFFWRVDAATRWEMDSKVERMWQER